ncbi:NAD(P)H pyrophosphatase NUDT13, mitochondrial [Eucyclogobius newberryi]|uniref:NAD(P)H pyrophosphatase NUDT13, mitochondrial n=1 Tax=Eucyclogobius newberryi TaxID=166745 RepID=UPI003B595262
MLNPLRVLVSGLTRSSARCCSGYVSRMRFLDHLKQDPGACEAALLDSDLMLFHSLKPLLKQKQDRSFSSVSLRHPDVKSLLQKLGADPSVIRDSVLIGCSDAGGALFCLDLAAVNAVAVEEENRATFVELRKSFFLLSHTEAPLVAKAQALLRWHQTHRFCSFSGKPTERNRSGSHRVTAGSKVIHYPQMSPVVIALVHDGSRCLLGRQASFPPGLYSALAGFCDMGETVEDTVRREVAEEAGLEVLSVTYSCSQHWPFPNSSFMIGCFAAVSAAHSQLSVDHSELEDARWFDLGQIRAGLAVSAPPRRGGPVVTWFPPRHAIGHQLIAEWAERQTRHLQP